MTDTLLDDDIIDVQDVPGTTAKQSGSSSSITTTSMSDTGLVRRPMYIETEMRTNMTTRRTNATGSGSVHDVLEKTKSPTDGLPPTTYTYAHSVSYMPVSQNGTYDPVPVMARRNLHNDELVNQYGSSHQYGSNSFASPTRILSNVRSQLSQSYSALRNRLSHTNQEHQQMAPGSPSRLQPATYQQQASGGARYSRTSSQSSNSGAGGPAIVRKGYNLRSRPIHSTPREGEAEQQQQQPATSTTSKKYSGRYAGGKHGGGEIDEEQDYDREGAGDDQDHHHGLKDENENGVVHNVKKVLHWPAELVEGIWHKLGNLPWWLLIPLLLLLGLYAVPYIACRPLSHYPESQLYALCNEAKNFSSALTNSSYRFIRRHTYDRGLRNLKQTWRSAVDLKDSIRDSLEDVIYEGKRYMRRSVGGAKSYVKEAVDVTTENAREYCDAGLQKMNTVIEELKREREKVLGSRHTWKPEQEKEIEAIIRQVLDEYAADEIGQADFALEANGAKVVDTRCTEYTDEPSQSVVKFLGIPIVHMSKHPDIMIKPGRLPGQCFPFKGTHGSVVIKLAVPVVPTEFVLEHLAKSISIVGHINSAPANFTIYSLRNKHDKEGLTLGHYYYDAEGPSLQRFKPQIQQAPLCEYIEFQVTTNHGNPHYTCVYRFRVHGDMQTVQPSAPAA